MLALMCVVLVLVAYFYVKYCYTYWDRKNVRIVEPTFLLGSVDKMMKKPFVEVFDDIYKSTDEPIVGFYLLTRPVLMIRDPDICQSILSSDAKYFPHRGFYVNGKVDFLSTNLVALDGEKALPLKLKLAPAFSTGKVKGMFDGIVKVTSNIIEYLEANKGIEVNVSDIVQKHLINISASVLFGMEINAIEDTSIPLWKAAQIFLKPSLKTFIRMNITHLLPNFGNLIRLKTTNPTYRDIIMSTIKEIVEDREKNGVEKIDLLQMLLQLRNSGEINKDDDWNFKPKTDNSVKMTLEEIAANVHAFFIAGHESSALTMSYCLFELAKNPAVQLMVQEEIHAVLSRHSNEITYEAVSEMKYLECCIHETLRMYPTGVILYRQCAKDFKVPGMDVVIEKGTNVITPTWSLQMDPKFYPNPEEFHPERFEKTSKTNPSVLYQTFGLGPRQCIAKNLGVLMTKTSLVAVLSNFTIHLGSHLEKTRKVNFARKAFLLSPDREIKLVFTKRNA